ncbi:MAG: 4Fe-4S binding protein, partial [Oscillospiraceae bacterium]
STISFEAEDLCILGVPSFGGRVPAAALARLVQMKAKNTPTILVAAYGNRDYDDTLAELKEALSPNGFRVIAAIAAVTEHSIMRQFGAGRPNAEDENVLRGFAKTIRQALEQAAALPEITLCGNTPYRDYAGLPLRPKASAACTKCGLCAALCPVHAIPPDQPSATQKDRCITCMRCVAVCPQHARALNPVMLFAAAKKMEKSCSSPKENVLFFESAPK